MAHCAPSFFYVTLYDGMEGVSFSVDPAWYPQMSAHLIVGAHGTVYDKHCSQEHFWQFNSSYNYYWRQKFITKVYMAVSECHTNGTITLHNFYDQNRF